jgi:hypothetical protein
MEPAADVIGAPTWIDARNPEHPDIELTHASFADRGPHSEEHHDEEERR